MMLFWRVFSILRGHRRSVLTRIDEVHDNNKRDALTECYLWLLQHNEYYREAVQQWPPADFETEIGDIYFTHAIARTLFSIS